ncbi:MAG: hypothetical protein Q8873_05865 [Bacillota bacterium]|nr:hypothetical protein [Bacillota bacterium]
MFLYLILTVSIFSMMGNNVAVNLYGKSPSKNSSDPYMFNLISTVICAVIFVLLSLVTGGVSVYTLVAGIALGILTNCANLFKVLAFSSGPLHYSNLIITSSFVIAAMYDYTLGGKPIEFPKDYIRIAVMIILLLFVFISQDNKKGDTKATLRWIGFCMVAFFANGFIGIVQRVHQTSDYRDQRTFMLAVTFVISTLFSAAIYKVISKKTHQNSSITLTSKGAVYAYSAGIFLFVMHYINLFLSGVMPSAIFFPLVNGGSIFLTSVASIVFFKEKITVKQLIGIIGGIACIVIIGLTS